MTNSKFKVHHCKNRELTHRDIKTNVFVCVLEESIMMQLLVFYAKLLVSLDMFPDEVYALILFWGNDLARKCLGVIHIPRGQIFGFLTPLLLRGYFYYMRLMK